MSAESWRKEYYPLAARLVGEDSALAHSVKKWEGLQAENLLKHGLERPPIYVHGNTCALCIHYADDSCNDCPLAKELGAACDDADSLTNPPWCEWNVQRNPKPMLAALQAAYKIEQENLRSCGKISMVAGALLLTLS